MFRDITDGPKVPLARHVDMTRLVIFNKPTAGLHGAVLPPCFVESSPNHNGGRIPLTFDHPLKFLHELLVTRLGPEALYWIRGFARPLRAFGISWGSVTWACQVSMHVRSQWW